MMLVNFLIIMLVYLNKKMLLLLAQISHRICHQNGDHIIIILVVRLKQGGNQGFQKG